MKVMLIRHGQTDANVGNILQGQMNTQLNARGKDQATLLGKALKDEVFSRAYTSDLLRAVNTLLDMSDHLKDYKPFVFIVDHRLRERHYGTAQGATVTWLREEAAKKGFVDYYMYTPEGAENYATFVQRIESFLSELFFVVDNEKAGSEEHAVVVTHGGLLTALMRYWNSNSDKFVLINFDPVKAIDEAMKNTGITRITIEPLVAGGEGKRRITFHGLNDVAHLNP